MALEINLLTETINLIRAFVFIFAFAFIVADVTEIPESKSCKLTLALSCLYMLVAVIIDCFLKHIVLAINSL